MLPLVLVLGALGADPAPTIPSPVGTGDKGFAGDAGPAREVR